MFLFEKKKKTFTPLKIENFKNQQKNTLHLLQN